MANDHGGGRGYSWEEPGRAGGRQESGDYGQRPRATFRDRAPEREADQARGFYGYEEDRIGGDQDYNYRNRAGARWNEGAQEYGRARRDRWRNTPAGGYQWERDERGQDRDGSRAYGSDYGRGQGGYFGGDYGQRDRGRTGEDNGRNWWDKTSDEVQSWFGDDDAARRRRMDEERSHRGRGPEGYRRSDERIREDVHDKLTEDWFLDASRIAVQVENGEVTLSGSVEHRRDKRRAEDVVEDVPGVQHVQNNIRVKGRGEAGQPGAASPGQTDAGAFSATRSSRSSAT